MDPQNDWSEDGTCIRCGGYALISGNGPARNGVTVSCEGDCGTYGAYADADGDLVEYAPLQTDPPAADNPDDPF
jgi:hypothetical protein